MQPYLRTVIVDDEEASTYWLSRELNEFPELSIVSIENSPEKALKAIVKLKPDLLFLDIEMPCYSGFELLKKVNEADLFPKVVFITAHQKYAIRAIKVLAFDYLLKPIDIDDLRKCVHRIIDSSARPIKFEIPKIKLSESLSEREEQILMHIIEGFTSTEISRELFISKSTVDSHRKSILAKTQAKNTAQLVVWGALDYFM